MKPENETLVILTPGFPRSETDTTCLPMQQSLVKVLKADFPHLQIIILSFQYPYHTKKYNWFNIPVIPFSGRNQGGLARLWLQRKIYATLKKIDKSSNLTGLLSFWYGECALLGKQFADKYHISHYCWILGQDAKPGNKYIQSAKLNANELIALSDFLQNEFEKNYGTRPQFIIPPGIDTKQFPLAPKERDIDIIAAGSLIPLKQFEIFIQVVSEIKKQVPGVKAMLIGDGPEKNKLQTLIAGHDLESNIILSGELPHPEVLQHMQRAKLFLHPSAYEGFGVVSLEALYAGCQVISFCRPMKQDIEHWHIVPDVTAMTKAALHILKNRGSVYKSLTPFTMDATVKQIMNLFTG
jgi:glycosyltransferase involved in cell wall biosynthesis